MKMKYQFEILIDLHSQLITPFKASLFVFIFKLQLYVSNISQAVTRILAPRNGWKRVYLRVSKVAGGFG